MTGRRLAGDGQRPHARRRRPASIAIKRAYDKPAPQDGVRILVDRLWPRGLSKAALKLDAWVRQLAPSTALRKWYGHEPARFAEFRRRYRAELAEHKDELAELRKMIEGRAADADHGDARTFPEPCRGFAPAAGEDDADLTARA